MGVPRAHSTRGQKGRRRSHLALKPIALISCPHCNKPKMGHQMCKYCGYYGNREIVNVIAKELKKKDKSRQSQK